MMFLIDRGTLCYITALAEITHQVARNPMAVSSLHCLKILFAACLESYAHPDLLVISEIR